MNLVVEVELQTMIGRSRLFKRNLDSTSHNIFKESLLSNQSTICCLSNLLPAVISGLQLKLKNFQKNSLGKHRISLSKTHAL